MIATLLGSDPVHGKFIPNRRCFSVKRKFQNFERRVAETNCKNKSHKTYLRHRRSGHTATLYFKENKSL